MDSTNSFFGDRSGPMGHKEKPASLMQADPSESFAYGETDFLARYPEEWNSVSVESEEKWVRNLRESQSTLAITCYIDGEMKKK